MKTHCLKLVILGDAGVGKTSLLNRFIKQEFSQLYRATIGCDFLQKEIEIGEDLLTLQIWDTAGQERYNSLGHAFYRGSDCFMLVYDITETKTFEGVDSWYRDFIQYVNNLPDFPILLVGNKIDLDSKRRVPFEQGEQWANEHNAMFIESSAKDNLKVEEAFLQLATKALQNAKKSAAQPAQGTITLSSPPQPVQGKKCC